MSYQFNEEEKEKAPRQIYQGGMFCGAEGAKENAKALEDEQKKLGVPDPHVEPRSAPNPLEYLALRMGFQTEASEKLAQDKIDAVDKQQMLIVHPHSQGVAQDYNGTELAKEKLTERYAPGKADEAKKLVPDGTTDTEVDDSREDLGVRTVGTDELRQRKASELAGEQAASELAKYNRVIATGASRDPNPTIPSKQINRVVEEEMPIGEGPETTTVKRNTDFVPLFTAPTQSGPNREVVEIPGNGGIAEHPYKENYSKADAAETKKVLDEVRPSAPAPAEKEESKSSGGWFSSFFSGWGSSSGEKSSSKPSSESKERESEESPSSDWSWTQSSNDSPSPTPDTTPTVQAEPERPSEPAVETESRETESQESKTPEPSEDFTGF